MRELTLKVTEKEARSIGERRWFRASWKKRIPLLIVCLAAVFGVDVVVPDAAGWTKALVILPLILGFFTLYYYFFRDLDKAGKKFLKEVMSGQRESS